ncbi:MAG TPA: hypothetical protein VER14_09880 [Phototrophicaceae bacterium]|nr:hypothetical protein [Phototrophicaceae bacterium]
MKNEMELKSFITKERQAKAFGSPAYNIEKYRYGIPCIKGTEFQRWKMLYNPHL